MITNEKLLNKIKSDDYQIMGDRWWCI